VHAAHRRAHDQPHPADAKSILQQPILRFDHVVIVIGGEAHAQAVGRLGRSAMADIVGQDDPVAADVERLAGPV
jgi:hypothetical protein